MRDVLKREVANIDAAMDHKVNIASIRLPARLRKVCVRSAAAEGNAGASYAKEVKQSPRLRCRTSSLERPDATSVNSKIQNLGRRVR